MAQPVLAAGLEGTDFRRRSEAVSELADGASFRSVIGCLGCPLRFSDASKGAPWRFWRGPNRVSRRTLRLADRFPVTTRKHIWRRWSAYRQHLIHLSRLCRNCDAATTELERDLASQTCVRRATDVVSQLEGAGSSGPRRGSRSNLGRGRSGAARTRAGMPGLRQPSFRAAVSVRSRGPRTKRARAQV